MARGRGAAGEAATEVRAWRRSECSGWAGRTLSNSSPLHAKQGVQQGQEGIQRQCNQCGLCRMCMRRLCCSCLLLHIAIAFAGSAGPGRGQLWQQFVSEALRHELTHRQHLVRSKLPAPLSSPNISAEEFANKDITLSTCNEIPACQAIDSSSWCNLIGSSQSGARRGCA